MYSRYYSNRKEEVRLPENYSGCAFPREHGVTEGIPAPILRDPPPTKKPPEEPPHEPAPPPALPLPVPVHEDPALPAPNSEGLLSRLSNLLEFDQMLILGLILLLLQSGENTETVFWLVLLLFC